MEGNTVEANSHIELWKFLLEILVSPKYREFIRWTGKVEGEFLLLQPEQVAKLWGERRGRGQMNYDKMSRALRFYYGRNRIEKQRGKHYLYRFACDLKQLTGHTGLEWAGKQSHELIAEVKG